MILWWSFVTFIYNCSSNMNYFIYTSHHFSRSPHGRCELNKWTSLPMCGFIAQLAEYCTGIAEIMGSNLVSRVQIPLKPWFFRASFQLLKLENLLRWSFFTFIYNHSSNMNDFIYTSHHFNKNSNILLNAKFYNQQNMVTTVQFVHSEKPTCLTKEFPWSLHCENLTAGSTGDSTVDVSVPKAWSPVADVPPMAPSGGEGWVAVVVPMVSCAGVDSVVVFVLLISDCGGWGWSVSSRAVFAGVRWVSDLSTVALVDEELGSGGDTLAFHSGPYIFSSDLETLGKKRIILNFMKNQTKPPPPPQKQLQKKASYSKAFTCTCNSLTSGAFLPKTHFLDS